MDSIAVVLHVRAHRQAHQAHHRHIIRASHNVVHRSAIAATIPHARMHALAKMPSGSGTAVHEYVKIPSRARINPRLDMPAHTVCARDSVPTMLFRVATASSIDGPSSKAHFAVEWCFPQDKNHSGCVRCTLTIPRRSVKTSIGKFSMMSRGEEGPVVEVDGWDACVREPLRARCFSVGYWDVDAARLRVLVYAEGWYIVPSSLFSASFRRYRISTKEPTYATIADEFICQ